jgi:hypothetical protein
MRLRRMATPLVSLALVACHHATKPVQHGTPCGKSFCSSDEVCLERPSAPGVPACISHGDCDAVPAGRDVVGEALAAVGLNRCTATIPTDFLGSMVPKTVTEDVFRLPHFDGIHHQPLMLPGWADQVVAAFPAPTTSHAVSDSLLEAAALLGHPIQARPYSHAVDGKAPLATAVSDFIAAQGGTPNGAAITTDAADVPMAIQSKVALLVYALGDSTQERANAFRAVPNVDELAICLQGIVFSSPTCTGFDPTNTANRALVATGVDWVSLYQAAYDLARAVEDSGLQAETGAVGFSFDQATPHGRIVLGDAGSQTHDESEDAIALLVDFGGDDTYRTAAGAAQYSTVPVALHIDLAGNDTYGYDVVASPNDTGRLPSDIDGRFTPGDVTMGETAQSRSERPRQGAGRGGIGLLFDYGGNDHYTSLRMSQGFGVLGVGVLADFAGDDVYEAEAGAQGGGVFGIGLLLDASGNDSYGIYTDGQGFGFTSGFGALIEGAGADVYFANPGDPVEGGDPLYYTPQLPGTGNSSFVQGTGFGRRYDDPEGAGSMSGGIGLLVDLGDGDDQYTASVFGQGAGYWFGTGLFYDEGGDDRYDGKWYVRGSAAHFALASFHDRAGNDVHGTGKVAPVDTSYGVGHDFSVSWFIDDAGDDTYNAPGLSIGSGNSCGWGFFIDVSGNDHYAAAGQPTMGDYGDPTDCSFTTGSTLGVLVDAGGTDSFEVAAMPVSRAGQTVTAMPDPMAPQAKGVALDGTGTVLILP